MLASAREHYANQRGIARRALGAARGLRLGSLETLVSAVAVGQLLAARETLVATGAMLEEQGLNPDPVATVIAGAVSRTANDGRDLTTLLDYARSPQVGAFAFDRIVLSQVRDSGRQAAVLASAVRPQVTAYTRMLVAPSCSRCAVLAGRTYRSRTPFRRHPGCDCRHIPSSEALAGDLTTDPRAYFDSLTEAEQERVFTKAGAQVIREGADVAKVVNARRGMDTAQVNVRGWIPKGRAVTRDVLGRPLYVTTEPMTKRGAAHRVRGRNYVRLMPESIVQIAGDQADLLRLLKAHGYIT